MVQGVKDSALSPQWLRLLLWHGFDPGAANMLRVWPKKKVTVRQTPQRRMLLVKTHELTLTKAKSLGKDICLASKCTLTQDIHYRGKRVTYSKRHPEAATLTGQWRLTSPIKRYTDKRKKKSSRSLQRIQRTQEKPAAPSRDEAAGPCPASPPDPTVCAPRDAGSGVHRALSWPFAPAPFTPEDVRSPRCL